MKKLFVLLFMLTCFSFVDHGNAGTISANGVYQGDLYKFIRAVNHSMRNRLLDSFDADRGTTATENIKTTTTANYIIDGLIYSFSVSSNIDLSGISGASTLPVQGASISKNYLLHINAAGAIKVNMSAVNKYPDGIDGYAPFALLQVGTLAGGSYTFGTTKLGATSVNYTVTDVVTIPSGNYGVQLSY